MRNVACEFAESPIENVSIGDYSLRFVKEFRTVEQYYAPPFRIALLFASQILLRLNIVNKFPLLSAVKAF